MGASTIDAGVVRPPITDIGSGVNGTSAESDNLFTGKKTIEELRRMLDDFRTTTQTNRQQGLIDIDYYDGKQWTTEETRILTGRGQPAIVVNRTRVAVNGILGVVARSHTDPKAWPRNPSNDDSASVATDTLRFVTEKARFNRTKVEAFKDNLLGGACAVIVGVDDDKNVTITKVRWEEFFYDPRSRETDFSDARYKGIAKWMYSDDIIAMYPATSQGLGESPSGDRAGMTITDESFQDRPIFQGWVDTRNRRFMVVEIYYRYLDRWSKCVFWYGGLLEEGESPWKNEKGIPSCPIIAESCYIDRDNMRYGIIRDMRDLQDEINKRRSKLLHIINTSQIQARDPSAIEVDANAARTEAARPDGVLPFGWEKVPTSDMAQGQLLLLTEAKNEMERFGPNPAILGRQGADTSGRALLARQQAGLIELAVVLDQMDDWELRVYKEVWARVKQFWTDPQYIRVTGDTNSPRFVQLNQPVHGPVPMIDPQTNQPMQSTDGQPIVMQGILGYKNNVAEIDVDIIIDTQPATATIMQEQLKDLMDLVGSNPAYASQVPFEVFIELMPIPRKSQIMAKIAAYQQQQQQVQQQTQQKVEAIQTATAVAKVGHIDSQTELNKAKAASAQGHATAEALRTAGTSASLLHDMQLEHEQAAFLRWKALQESPTGKVVADSGPTG